MTASGWPWAEIAAVYAVGSLVTAWLLAPECAREGARNGSAEPAPLVVGMAVATLFWPLYWAAVAWRSLRGNRRGAR